MCARGRMGRVPHTPVLICIKRRGHWGPALVPPPHALPGHPHSRLEAEALARPEIIRGDLALKEPVCPLVLNLEHNREESRLVPAPNSCAGGLSVSTS